MAQRQSSDASSRSRPSVRDDARPSRARADQDPRDREWIRLLGAHPSLVARLEELAATLPQELVLDDADDRFDRRARARDERDEHRVKTAATTLIAAIDALRAGDTNTRYFFTDAARGAAAQLLVRLDQFNARRERFHAEFEARVNAEYGTQSRPPRGNPKHVRQQVVEQFVVRALEQEGLPVTGYDGGLYAYVMKRYFDRNGIAERSRLVRRAPRLRDVAPPSRQRTRARK